MKTIRHALSPHHSVPTSVGNKKKRAKQSFRDACDVNKIIRRYDKTGVINHLNQAKPSYGYAPSVDFREALEIVSKAEIGFASLPSAVRAKFANDPAAFLSFIEDPSNRAEMVELGLLEAPVGETPAAPSDSATEPLAPSPAELQNEAKNGE